MHLILIYQKKEVMMLSNYYESLEELKEKLEDLEDEFVVLETDGGQEWFAYVDEVEDGWVKLKYVEFYSPACPCNPLFYNRALVAINQITGVISDIYYYPPGAASPAGGTRMDAVKRVQDRAAADSANESAD